MAAFDVYLDVLLSMRYRVPDAATPDEAEGIAEKWAEAGIKGAVVEREILPGAAERVSGDDFDEEREADPYEEEDEQ
jgi:hypothetical protein